MSKNDIQIGIRPYRDGDYPFLRAMCYEAIYWRPDKMRLSLNETFANPTLGGYINHWGGVGDTAVVAERSAEMPVGAAWYRFFPADAPGYGFLAPEIPEVGIGVAANWRGRGVGRAMLVALRDTAQEQGLPALSLSVAKANGTAFRLYEACGFTVAEDDGDAWKMRVDLGPL